MPPKTVKAAGVKALRARHTELVRRVKRLEREGKALRLELAAIICECTDPGCPAHKDLAFCGAPFDVVVYRSDMQDRTGTPMCDQCAEDAMNAGVFFTKGA